MNRRKLTHAPAFKNHPIATDDRTACDMEALASIDTLLSTSLKQANYPRLLLYDIHIPCIRHDVNELFRAAQADFCKNELRQEKAKTRYVGFKDISVPNTIRVAVVYDSKEIRDSEILHSTEQILNRKIGDDYCPAMVEPVGEESIMLDKSNYNDCYYHASKIARVEALPANRQRVLFSSKG